MSDPLRDRLAAALGPNYELQRLLGKGGMGSVYLARESALDRLVAVKVLPPEVTGDAETRERFRREARTAAKLTHPHIVPLHSFGEAEGLLWFVMGYVAGETLAAKLERTPRYDPELARRVLADVADALDYAHSHGIVHRDVKPENILIEDAGGKALLADFGVARAGTGATTLTTAGALVGTPLYMSPEQASGERDLDGRSDLYSLGVVGYRMLAGRTPFEGGELRAVLAAHITQPAPALPADAPEDLARALLRALTKSPVERWQSGKELRDSIGATEILTADEIDRLGGLPGYLTGVGISILIVAVVGLLWSAAAPTSEFLRIAGEMIPFMVGVLSISSLALIYSSTRRLGITFGKAVRIALWPPAGWTLPWPGRWRRPRDLWTQLPPFLRRMRGAVGAVAACYLVLIPLMLREAILGNEAHNAHQLYLAGIFLAIAAVQLAGLVAVVRYGKRHGLNFETSVRLTAKPTWNDPFWKKPEIARLLLPVGTVARRAEEPRTPAEIAAAVRQVAASFSSHHASLAQDAAARAEAIARKIAAMDTELSGLGQEVRAEDLAAVEKKLTDLGPVRPDEPEARQAIRAANEQHLAILQRLSQQLVEGQGRREHLAGLLRTLYLQVSELNVEAKKLTDVDTSGVREIVDRMAREVEGLREVGG